VFNIKNSENKSQSSNLILVEINIIFLSSNPNHYENDFSYWSDNMVNMSTRFVYLDPTRLGDY